MLKVESDAQGCNRGSRLKSMLKVVIDAQGYNRGSKWEIRAQDR
jgi:hypothetical protein